MNFSIKKKIKVNFENAYRIAIFNSIFFLLFSFTNFLLLFPSNIQIIGLLIFIIGSSLSFIFFVLSRGVLAPITWITLGSALYIGIGSIASLLELHPYYDYIKYYLINIKYSYILNALSLLIIYAVSYLITKRKIIDNSEFLYKKIQYVMKNKHLLYFLIFSILLLTLKLIYFFPNSESKIIETLIHKLYFIETGVVFFFSIRFMKENIKIKFLIIIFLIIELILSLTLFSKFHIIKFFIAILLGLFVCKQKFINLIVTFFILIIIFNIITPITTISRTHNFYISEMDSLRNLSVNKRLIVMMDSYKLVYGSNQNKKNLVYKFYKNHAIVNFCLKIADNYQKNNCILVVKKSKDEEDILDKIKKMFQKHVEPSFMLDDNYYKNSILNQNITSLADRIRYYFIRFDVISPQRYLMSEYDNGFKGNSLDNFWSIFIPRIFWKDKPILSNEAILFHNKYYQHAQKNKKGQHINKNKIGFKENLHTFQKSSLSASMFGEMYWNYGWFGNVFMCFIYGLLIGFLNNLSSFYKTKVKAVSYSFVSISVITWSSHMEGWLVGTVMGEIIIILVIYLFIRLSLFLINIIPNYFFNNRI